MRISLPKILLVIFIIAVGSFGYLAWRASRDLVTLNVRDMEVRKVVGKIEWQTWENIFVGKEVSGKVTLNVHNMPLEDVLEIIGEQTSSRWSTIYPLYTSSKSLGKLEKALVGEISASENGWKELRGGGRFGTMGGGMFGAMTDNNSKLITVNLNMKQLDIATIALSRYSRAQIVPEDGTHELVSLKLANQPVSDGVKQLAKQAHRSWTKLYSLESFRRDRGPRGPEDGPPRGGFAGQSDGSSTNRGEFDWAGRREFSRTNEDFQKRMEAQLESMTPEERAQFEKRRNDYEAMRNMTPEQRRDAFQKMASSPDFQNRMQSRMMQALKNTTPEQRVERDIRRNQRAANGGGQRGR